MRLDSHVIVGRVRSAMSTVLVYLPTAVLPAAPLFMFHSDWLAKEERYTCCLAKGHVCGLCDKYGPRFLIGIVTILLPAARLFGCMKDDSLHL